MSKNPKPKIIGFLCNWCAYAGADLAGVSRLQYPPDLRIIRVMCSGRIDPVFIFRAFKLKADGVLVLGCHPGDCHYQSGNYYAARKAKFITKVLQMCGIESERFMLDWVSAAEGPRFAEVVSDFTRRIQNLPPINETDELEKKAELSLKVAETERLRWLIGKEADLTTQGNVYNELIDQKQFDKIMDKNIRESFLMHQIRSLIVDNPLKPSEIAEGLNISAKEAFRLLLKMEDSGLVAQHDMQDRYPRFVQG
ncbi:MAG: hydrogenase iron-sulfur subunit [bacterium]|nr:hydrogenase iron-sulfur subunit [bacterium]